MTETLASLAAQQRLDAIAPFYAMEIVKRAEALRREGRDLVSLALGEPDFTAPSQVQDAAVHAIRRGNTAYTPALGLPALREAIAAFHQRAYGLAVDPQRVVVTAGASGALMLACAALFGRGDEVLMPDPCYPCNRHFVANVGAQARLIPTTPAERFHLTAQQVEQHWNERTHGVLIASPSNPTGTSMDDDALEAVWGVVQARNGVLIADEIYHGLSYSHASRGFALPGSALGFPRSALALGEDVVTLSSFSKFFCMTGWRLGWMVVPHRMLADIEKLAQNLTICPSAVAQHAALACFDEPALQTYVQRRDEFRARRDMMLPGLRNVGFELPVEPDGAFYAYADVSCTGLDSADFCELALEETGVVMVPGRDFGFSDPGRFVRISYATSQENIREALDRLGNWQRLRRA
jgi:aspartate/methionine/tyrosine aminotransferase